MPAQSQYQPKPLPVFKDEEIQRLTSYLTRELQAISDAFTGVQAIQLPELNVAPIRLVTGMVVLADGVHWNPGAGKGFYGYDGSAWQFLGTSLPGSLGRAWNTI